VPVTLPFRTDALCRMLERYHPIWVTALFNHPKGHLEVAEG
jgi:lysine 2,3-aminomutase